MRLRDLEGMPISIYNTRDELMRHVYDRSAAAFDQGDRDRDALRAPEDVEARTCAAREAFLAAIGGLPQGGHPLSARTVGIIDETDLTIEKVIFESRPYTYVTANLYLPRGARSPGGAVLFLCGHHERAKHDPEYQIVCRYLAAAGLVVLAMDPIGQGERVSYYEPGLRESTVRWGTAEHDYAGRPAFLAGSSLARYFLHDAMCGFDYLASRPEVDPGRIGVTGNSGGGTQTSLMLLGDRRIAAAAPATFIMNRRTYLFTGQAQDAEQIWPGMSAAGFDHEDILLMAAPRPVLVLAVSWDFFPIEGTLTTVDRCRRIWQLYGAPEAIRVYVDESLHAYTPRMAAEAARFFSLHLLGREADVSGLAVAAIEPCRLWCTRDGQVRSEFPRAAAVHEENRTLSIELTARRAAGTAAAREWLRSRVFAHRVPCPLNERRLGVHVADGFRVRRSVWWAQEGILNHGVLIGPPADEQIPHRVRIAVWDGGTTALAAHLPEIRASVDHGFGVFVLDVTGTGPLTPNPVNAAPMQEFYGTLFKLADDLLWLDDSLAAIRVYDVTRAVELLESLGASAVEVYAEGRHGTWGILAALVDPRIRAVSRGPGIRTFRSFLEERHYDETDIMGIVIPGILEHLDLDEIVPEGTP